MASTLQVSVISPERVIFEGSAEQVVAPAWDGEVGILRGHAPLWIFVVLLVVYASAGIVTGIQTADYHVIGFIGGLKGFLANPIGRGIGVGGNLSIDMATRLDWSRSQSLGHTDVAVESAVGVLLYQMGVFGAVVLALFGWIADTWGRETAIWPSRVDSVKAWQAPRMGSFDKCSRTRAVQAVASSSKCPLDIPP